MPKDKFETLKCNQKILEYVVGFEYCNEGNGTQMIELHVDSCTESILQGNVLTFGGNLSVRCPSDAKPLVIFGQDECVFSQFLLPTKQWVGPNGERALLPKTDGMSLMVSAFQSREFGFGLEITCSQLEEINFCRMGKITKMRMPQ